MAHGQSIVIKGEISGAEDLVIAGRVEGKIRLENNTLTLSEGAEVKGEVTAGSIIVSGTISGSLKASARVDIRPSATVDGEIHTPVLVVGDGARITAAVEMPAPAGRGKLAVAV